MERIFRTRSIMAGALITLLFSSVTMAHHAWRKFHWATTTGIVSVQVVDNTNGWSSYVSKAISDWDISAVIKPNGASGNNTSCTPVSGRIDVCNGKYGTNGWLGIAQIWIQGTSHIYQGTTKLNDTYFANAPYTSAAWHQFVACQEIGHDFGLDHQDERNGNVNLGSCMDYTNDPDGGAGGASNSDPANTSPNAHDYDQLLTIYNHKDSTNTAGAAAASANAARPEAAEWGRLVRTSPDNRVQTYERDLGGGHRVVTHVFWADPDADAREGGN